MKATAVLMNEHEIIKSMILNATERMALTDPLSIEEFDVYYKFFIGYADKFHHEKEENIYFKWLINKDQSLEKGVIAKMLHDHDYLRKTLLEAKKFISNHQYPQFKSNFLSYCEILYNHIFKEDNILYKMAENLNKEFKDGDDMMMEKFLMIEAEAMAIYKKWKDYPIHAIVRKESEILKVSDGKSSGGCCGMC